MRRGALAPQAARIAGARRASIGIASRHGGSPIEWMPRNVLALRHRIARCYDSRHTVPIAHEMNQPAYHVQHTASRVAGCVGDAWVDSGIAPGLVVIDAMRPAMTLAAARGLLRQFGAAH